LSGDQRGEQGKDPLRAPGGAPKQPLESIGTRKLGQMSKRKNDTSFVGAINRCRYQVISDALAITSGNICQAAKLLKMHRNTLSRWIVTLKIDYQRDVA
jgi:transcriptional regulator with PAS, ATPase and Fis domain